MRVTTRDSYLAVGEVRMPTIKETPGSGMTNVRFEKKVSEVPPFRYIPERVQEVWLWVWEQLSK